MRFYPQPKLTSRSTIRRRLSSTLLSRRPRFRSTCWASVAAPRQTMLTRSHWPRCSSRAPRRGQRAAAFAGLYGHRAFYRGGEQAERDPLMVVGRLDRQLDGDAVIGDNLSAFVEFLVQHLDRQSASAPAPPPTGTAFISITVRKMRLTLWISRWRSAREN